MPSLSTRAYAVEHADRNPFLPRLLGHRAAVACEHYLAALAARDILQAGGNAIDAAVAATLVEGVVNPQMHTFGGECAILVHVAGSAQVVAVNGNTAAPAAATPAAYRARGLDAVPDHGVLAAGVPAAPAALLTALGRFGRLPFAAVSEPARTLAREGPPVHRGLVHQRGFGLAALESEIRANRPGAAALYLPEGRLPREGERLPNPALADLLDHLAGAERAAGGDRARGIRAAHDAFYRGEPAAIVAAFVRERDGLLAREDLAAFEAPVEPSAYLDFRGARVFKCGGWNQGPALLQSLAILDRFDLRAMGAGSAAYLHTLIEAMNLAFADREQYYGDPSQVDVPLAALLDPAYAATRADLIDPARASDEVRPGDPRRGRALLDPAERLGGRAWGPGTVHVDVIDAEGNAAAFTPSGAWLRGGDVIAQLGVPLGNRLMTFYLGPDHHPNVVAPRKRPRTTISPTLVLRDGAPWLAFGSMGGDQQDQWQLQFLLYRLVFGMSLQAAIEAPKLSSEHFPGFFSPHDRFPRRVRVEPRLGAAVLAELAARGHVIDHGPDWSEGYLLAAERHPDGLLEAGCDPRGTRGEVFPAFALAW